MELYSFDNTQKCLQTVNLHMSSLLITMHTFEDKGELKEGDLIRYEFLKPLKATGKELRRLKLALGTYGLF